MSDIEKDQPKASGKQAEILEELKKYNDHTIELCLECGYRGRMGVTTDEVLGCSSGLVVWPIYIICKLLFKSAYESLAKRRAVCPACKKVNYIKTIS